MIPVLQQNQNLSCVCDAARSQQLLRRRTSCGITHQPLQRPPPQRRRTALVVQCTRTLPGLSAPQVVLLHLMASECSSGGPRLPAFFQLVTDQDFLLGGHTQNISSCLHLGDITWGSSPGCLS